MEAVTKWRGPPLALSWLTRATVIWLGGCLAVCTLDSCASTFPPPLPYIDLAQVHSPWSKAPCRHFLTIYVLVPQAGACPALKSYPLAHLAHASWPPRRVVIVLHHCLSGEIVTYWLLCKCKAEYLADISEHQISHFLWNNRFYSRSTGTCSSTVTHTRIWKLQRTITLWSDGIWEAHWPLRGTW